MSRRPGPKWGQAAMVFGLAAMTLPVQAQFTYPGCAAVDSADFHMVPLVTNKTDNTMQEPLKMALHANAQGNVDVYFVQRYGLVRKYDGTAKSVTNLANFNYGTDSISAGYSEGLEGIALDPAFDSNHWMYLYLAIKTSWRVERYTLSGNSLDLSTKKTIFAVTAPAYSQHMGGTVRFDSDGNMWISMPDDGGGTVPTVAVDTDLYLAANTNSYFGKILRIKPIDFPDDQNPSPGAGATYTIPDGNLFPAGTAKTLPEIYIMGDRNPYTIDFDPVRKAVTWGEVGPDNFPSATDSNQWTEEDNFSKQPGFFGWPYWAGNQTNLPTQPLPAGSTPAHPINNRSDNTGLTNLPPAIPPIVHYVKSCAITGPVYYYDGSNPSTIKFPPHFNGAWFIGDFDFSWIDAVQLNAAGTAITNRMRVVSAASTNSTLYSPLEMQMGPDGALYVVNYAGYRSFSSTTGIYQIQYTGSPCQPAAELPEAESLKPEVNWSAGQVVINRFGPASIQVHNLSGHLEWSQHVQGPGRFDLSAVQAPGVHLVRVTASTWQHDFKFVR